MRWREGFTDAMTHGVALAGRSRKPGGTATMALKRTPPRQLRAADVLA